MRLVNDKSGSLFRTHLFSCHFLFFPLDSLLYFCLLPIPQFRWIVATTTWFTLNTAVSQCTYLEICVMKSWECFHHQAHPRAIHWLEKYTQNRCVLSAQCVENTATATYQLQNSLSRNAAAWDALHCSVPSYKIPNAFKDMLISEISWNIDTLLLILLLKVIQMLTSWYLWRKGIFPLRNARRN